jgi:dTDP-4-amino-4,6-dideoxygalactose transaminase
LKNELALFGGQKTINEDLAPHIKWPIIEQDDFDAVQSILASGNLSMHPVRLELEEAYKEHFNRKFALSHCNGTSALMAAFFAIDLKPGDEVLVTAATWWASVVPIFWFGAIPVFCENEDHQFGICPEDMKTKITSRTKAVVLVHLWGIPSKFKEIKEIATEYNIKIIEDASHSHGAEWHGKKCGTLGDMSIFSLQGDKLAPAGEGGILLTDNYTYWEKAVCLGDVTRIYQLETPSRYLAATSFGIKTRMAPMSAALGLSQFKKLEKNNKRRSDNIHYLSERIEKLGFNTYLFDKEISRTYFEFLIRWCPRKESEINFKIRSGIDPLIKALAAEGVAVTRPRYPLLHQQPFFTEGFWKEIVRDPEIEKKYDFKKVLLPRTESVNQELIKLPHFSTATKDFLDQYVVAFEKVMGSIDQIFGE